MNNKFALNRYLRALGLVAFLGMFMPATGQSPPEPTREQLLNGLPVLYLQRPGDANVLLKLRLKSGAAFDFAEKGGAMALLGDALFPDPSTREYVTEQLDGKLEVRTTYDAIDVTISGRATDLERMIELLRNALLGLNLAAENVKKLREARISSLTKSPLSASQIADQAIAERLFGAYPYGHSAEGTAETVARVERADLMLARERFLHADNALLAVIGGVDKARLLRALRQMLGPWQKSDRMVPATFRQPNAPDGRVLLINHAGSTNSEIRLALRGLARSDRDALAATMLAYIARDRWQAALPDLSSVGVRHEAHLLPGAFVWAATSPTSSAAKAVSTANEVMRALIQNGVSAAELEKARMILQSEAGKRAGDSEYLADVWLDTEIYKGQANTFAEINRLTAADINRVANRLFKDAAIAKVAVGSSMELKSVFGENIEIRAVKPEVKPGSESTTPAARP
jgi:zinc protease